MNTTLLFALLAVFLGCWFNWLMLREIKNSLEIETDSTNNCLYFIGQRLHKLEESVSALSAQIKAMDAEANRDAKSIKIRQAHERNRSRKVVKAHKGVK